MYLNLLNNITTNNKGATAFKSTNNPVLDLFTASYEIPTNKEDFTRLINTLTESFKTNPELTIKLAKYKRLIKKGDGSRMLTYIMMILIKSVDKNMYKDLLNWFCESNRDLLRLDRIDSMYSYLNNIGSSNKSSNLNSHIELDIFVDRIYSTFFDIFEGIIPINGIDLLPIKYLPSNNSHYENARKIIKNKLNDKLTLSFSVDYLKIFTDDTKNSCPIRKKLASILLDSYGCSKTFITNKSLRQIKSFLDSYQYLATPLLKGFHHSAGKNNSEALKFGYSNNNEITSGKARDCAQSEITSIGYYLTKLSTQALEKVKNTIKKYQVDVNILSEDLREKYLYQGLQSYFKTIKKNPDKLKTNGLILTDRLWNYFKSQTSENIDDLELQVKTQATELINYVSESFDQNYSLNSFINELEVVIDISGSMDGLPLKTGLYHILLLWEAFDIKTVTYFSDGTHKTVLPENYSIKDKIKFLYKNSDGSTNLENVFKNLVHEYNSGKKKFVLIFTDGDCDYCFGKNQDVNNNPFHVYYNQLPNHRFCVYNLKMSKLSFPYLMDDKRVSYLGGNNIKTLVGLVKSLVNSVKNNTDITPNDILLHSLDLPELNFDFTRYKHILNYFNHYLKLNIENLYNVILKNLPQNEVKEINNLISDNSDSENSDFEN